MRVGVVGCGAQGNHHLDAFAQIEGVEIVAVCDLDRTRREEAAARTGAAPFASHRELLAASQVDLLSICTMPNTHEEIACLAMRSGADVLCEKPLARTLAEARVMADVARETGRTLATGLNMRHMERARHLKQAIDAGTIGRPLAIRAFMLDPTIPWWGKHYVKAANGGGVIQADGWHCLDLALWTVGYPRPLTVSGSVGRVFPHKGLESSPSDEATREYDVEDIAGAHVRLEGGAWMTLELQWRADRTEPAFGYEIVGELGRACFEPFSLCVQRDGELVELAAGQEPSADWQTSVRRGVAEVVGALRRGEPAPTILEQALAVQAIADGVYASAAAGREVELA